MSRRGRTRRERTQLAKLIGAHPRIERVPRSDADVRLFFEFYSRTAVGDKWLCIVVKYLPDDAFVTTAYLTDKMKTGETIWPTK